MLRLDPKEDKRRLEMYASGMKDTAIAKAVGIAPTNVVAWRRQRGLPPNANPGNARPVVERFWDKVNKEGPVPQHVPSIGKCWVWTGSTRAARYGTLWVKPTMVPAHRISWEIHNGAIPPKRNVLHKCDNGFCVRPTHLFLGTQYDNVMDAIAKNRWRPS